MTTIPLRLPRPDGLALAAGLGLAWNLFGVSRFFATAFQDAEALAAAGMTPEQAALYAGLPGWMTLAFALGVFGGLAGSALLLLRHRAATPVLAVSLLAYAVLFVGDITEGVFAAFGIGQVAILAFVLLVAAGLLLVARRAGQAGALA
jgi:hypothetical protein